MIHRSKRSVFYQKDSVINFTAVRYSLYKCSETIHCLKRQFTVYVSPVSHALEFMKA